MLVLIYFLITAFAAVRTEDLVGVSYDFEEIYFENFIDRKCTNTTQWLFVTYNKLELEPPYGGGSKSIKALRNSCTSSFPIVFFNGTLEITVYLRTISQNSALTISVCDEQDTVIASVRYQRSLKNFVKGWVIVTVPIKKTTTGYVQLSGQSLVSELVIIDSLRYVPDKLTDNERFETVLYGNVSSNIMSTNRTPDEFIFAFDENGSGDEGSGDEGSGDEDIDEDEDSETETNVTEDPDTEENPGTDTEPSPDEDNENSGEPSLWNVFTITFVSVVAFTAVGMVGVGSYYLGKNRGLTQNPPLDLEALEPPSTLIPRARSGFANFPSDR